MTTIVPRTLNQREYLRLLDLNQLPILLTVGPKSVGKKFLALSEGFRKLNNNNFEKLIVTFPCQTKHDIEDDVKTRINMINYLKTFNPNVNKLIGSNKLIVDKIPIIYGKNLSNSFVVGLNMSSSSPTEMSLLLNNYGRNSKFVVMGDNTHYFNHNGLTDILCKVNNSPGLNYIKTLDFNKTEEEVITYGVSFELFKLYSNSFKKINRINSKYDEM